MLWAWERPGDLQALPKTAGVAFLAATLDLRDGTVRTILRRQPLRIKAGAFRMAVIRIEATHIPKGLTPTQQTQAVESMLDVFRAVKPDAVQIDFDALVSQRAFYTNLLRELRARLAPGTFLSITALVSWCGSKSWLAGLPVDEIVPMTFEMGRSAASAETRLRSGGRFENPLCQASIGIAAQDLDVRPRSYSRTYVFVYENWTGDLVRSLVGRL